MNQWRNFGQISKGKSEWNSELLGEGVAGWLRNDKPAEGFHIFPAEKIWKWWLN